MKTLIAEDDFTSRLLLQEILKGYGAVHIAVNGKEAVKAFGDAMDAREPYDLVCLDIMMPEMNGYAALREIRGMEEARGILSPRGTKVFMTTALDAMTNVIEAFRGQCDVYLVKPVDTSKLLNHLRALELIA